MAQAIPAEEAFAGTKPVEERHRLDETKLDEWMRQSIEDYRGPLTLLQFRGGQSNPTYKIETPARSYVLRRKPFGKLLPSAHAVDREFRVISALHKQGFPVARPYALCVDQSVVGTTFYVMSMVEGRVLWNATLPAQTPAERRAIYQAEVATLADLHKFDPEAIGLADYGKPGNYFARQIDRWSKQYRASETKPIVTMDRLIAWLPTSVPLQDRVSIVHGDYRLDNMIFHSAESRIAGVLDWELSTLGDPLADFTYFLMNWTMPPEGRSGLRGLDLSSLGIPTIAETIEHYCRATGRPAIPALDWYFAYNLFRIAAISQGIAKRIVEGTAANERAREVAERAVPLADAAWSFAEKIGA